MLIYCEAYNGSATVPQLDDQIEMARRHVLDGRRIVAGQRQRIAKGEVHGEGPQQLLASFERSLEIFEQDLERLLRARDRERRRGT